MSPGNTPAMNILPIEIPGTTIPYKMNAMLGGTISPRLPPAEINAAANDLE